MFRLTKITSLIILTVIFYGCEYNLTKENFMDLQPPSDSRYFNLNLIPTGDTVKIFGRTDLDYSFNTDGLDILEAHFKLQDKTWNFYSKEGSISIDPKDYQVGSYTLTLSIYLKSGTGSIADDLRGEGYYLEKKWIVLLDGNPAPPITPTQSITREGYLKIEWPKCDKLNFVAYEVDATSGNRTIQKTINDASQTFYIDSLYVGGTFRVRINTRVVKGFTWGNFLNINIDPPTPTIREIGFDSLQISWNKSPFKAKYRLNWTQNNNLLYFNSAEDTVCTIAQIGFGNWADFRLDTRSQNQEGWTDISYAGELPSYKRYYMGYHLVTANWPNFAYNSMEKALYSNQYDDMQCFDINTNALSNSRRIDNLIYGGLFSCPTNSTKVATTSNSYIHIFDNKNFENPIVFSHGIFIAAAIDHFMLTNNDLIAIASDNVYKLMDITTKKTVASINITDYPVYSKWACITTSQDGHYMCTATLNGIKIYNIATRPFTEVYSDNRGYRSAYFNPQNPNQLYLTLDAEPALEVRNPSDFSLQKKINLPSKMVIENIDPVTNNLLLTFYEKLYILNSETGQVLLTIPCDEYKIWLFDNHLFTNSGFALDISKKI
ncbi:MAG: hypothetical protein ACM3O8_01560 [Methylococcaceae bacterium]